MATTIDPRDLPALLAPSIKSAADEMDRLRDLPAELLAELAEAGAFQLFAPRELGGFEASRTTALQVYEDFGRIDGSVGWIVWNGNWGFLGALLGEPGRDAVWSDGNPVLCNAGQPGIAVPVDGGYHLSGDWKLVSGSHGSDWMITLGMVQGRLSPPLLFAVRRDQMSVHDTWQTSGLRGSGSNRVVLDNVFVPEDLVGRPDRLRIDRPLYHGFIPTLVFAGSAAVVLGIARGALEETVEMVAAKPKLAEHGHTQSVIARSQASLKAARLLLHDAAAELDAAETVTLAQRAGLRAAMANAATASRKVLMDMYELGSSSAIVAGSPIERRFQDGMVALQHFSFSEAYVEAVGKVSLGQEPGMPIF